MDMKNYTLWTALVTPLNKDLSIDFESFDKLIEEQCQAKNGLLVLGSTGEALNLTLEQKKSIVNHVTSKKHSSPLMIGVGGHDLVETKNWLNFLETKNIDGYLMVTPIYSKPGDEGQYQWFKTLMDMSSKPVMLYNVPGRAAKELSFRAVERLRSHRNFWSIKEASGSVQKFLKYREASGNAPVFCGDDALMPDFAANGSAGLISVASNVWPAQTNLYVKQCLTKKFDAKSLWEKASNSLFIASNPVPAKVALFELGRIKNNTMMPPLSALDFADWTPVKNADAEVNRWFKDSK